MSSPRWSAVVFDPNPAIALGIAAALWDAGVSEVEQVTDLDRALVAAASADLLVLGGPSEELAAGLAAARWVPRSRVLVLVDEGPGLPLLLQSGIEGLVDHRVTPARLGATVRRLLAGERVIDPALLPRLVDRAC